MSVRAKFKVTRVETQIASMARRNADGSYTQPTVYDKVEQRTVVLHPVYSDDPASENKVFWDATPSGEIRLGILNPSAWQAFDLDGEYYVDFSKAN